jgi:hypothetical protein
MPTVGDVFQDVRGDDRTMRVSYHQDRGVIVVSLWADTVCRGSFRLATDDVGRLAALLADIASPPEATPSPADTAAEVQPVLSPEQTGDVRMSVVPRVA